MPQSLLDQLTCHIKARTPVIQINTSDPQYIKSQIQLAAAQTNYDLYSWNLADEVTRPKNHILNIDTSAPHLISLYSRLTSAETSAKEESEIFKEISSCPAVPEIKIDEPESGSETSLLDWFQTTCKKYFILVMEDLDYGIRAFQPNVQNISRLKNICCSAFHDRILIIIRQNDEIPKDLEHCIAVLTCEFPGRDALKIVFRDTLKEFGMEKEAESPVPDTITDAVLGLTTTEAKRAFSLALTTSGHITEEELPFIHEEKRTLVQRAGLLSFVRVENSIADIGGLDALKEWIVERKEGYSNEAANFGIQQPKGILLIGPPGTGKSLAAKTIAAIWNWPLIHLDVGRVFAQWVGESEKNMRKALSSVDAFAPCILWIDEIEKGFAGNSVDDDGANGTTARVFGTMITWLQERTSPVFIVATANNIKRLPPEFLRKGRFNELFFIDLPGIHEREEIIKIHLEKRGHSAFTPGEMHEIAELSKGFSGAELENAVEDSLVRAFARDKILTADDMKTVVKSEVPLSLRRFEEIRNTRELAKVCGVAASSEKSDADTLTPLTEYTLDVMFDMNPSYR